MGFDFNAAIWNGEGERHTCAAGGGDTLDAIEGGRALVKKRATSRQGLSRRVSLYARRLHLLPIRVQAKQYKE